MNNVRIMYLRDSAGRPVGSLAMRLVRNRNQVEYQYSVQNPVDNFDRKLGRQLALGRMLEDPFIVKINKNATMHDISNAVLTDLAHAKSTPTRAARAASHWLRAAKQRPIVFAQMLDD